MKRLLLLAFLCALPLAALRAADEPAYKPTPENLKAREWFRDARFGLFIHWGIYSVLGEGEWVMNNKKIPVAEYEKLAAKFNPTEYDPAEWVRLAKAAGMKYIAITAKHHDGFAMWDSKVSDYNVVKATPYKKDVLKMLADECHKQKMPLFFYYSHLDWHHNDYYPRGQTGHNTGRPEQGKFDRYLDYMDAQLTELLTGYGPVAGIWFDGWWDQQDPAARKKGDPKKTRVDWRLERTYALIHKLQPGCLVGNNHHVPPFPGEDFQMFEKDLPGGNTTGFSGASKISSLPLETCETINNAWGYNKNDRKFKSKKDLIHYLVKAAGNDANFLLNVGPEPSGKIQPEFVERLKEMGVWTSKYGKSIYGTRGGPVPPQKWGVTTQSKDGKTVYVHILDPKAESIDLPGLEGLFGREGKVMGTNQTVGFGATPKDPKTGKGGAFFFTKRIELDPIDTIIVIEMPGKK